MAHADTVELTIEGTWNARDAATLTNLRPGVLYRSAGLPGLTDAGRAEFAALGITDVVDLRSDAEVASAGADAVPEGVRVHRLGITAGAQLAGKIDPDTDPQAMVAHFLSEASKPGWIESFMANVYVHLVTDPDAIRALGKGLNLIADPERVVLSHCSAGKDRTGVFTALAATIAGADEDAIDADFLYSNHYVDQQMASIPAIPGLDPETIRPMMGVQIEQLRSARSALVEHFGSLRGFLDAAEVSPQATEAIRSRLARA